MKEVKKKNSVLNFIEILKSAKPFKITIFHVFIISQNFQRRKKFSEKILDKTYMNILVAD